MNFSRDHRTTLGALSATIVVGFLVGATVGAPDSADAEGTARSIGSPAHPPSFGGVTEAMYDSNGDIRLDSVPDLIEVADHEGGIAGYAWKTDVFPPEEHATSRPEMANIAIYDQTGTELLGYLVPDHGFVGLDTFVTGDLEDQTITTVTYVDIDD